MIGKPHAIHFDVWDMAIILDLDEAESVKRLARKDKLPPRIPVIKKYLWMPEVVYDWLVSGYKAMKETIEEEKALKLALKTGTPIEQITLYGHYPQGLIEWYRQWKHLDDTKTQSK